MMEAYLYDYNLYILFHSSCEQWQIWIMGFIELPHDRSILLVVLFQKNLKNFDVQR